MTFYLPLSTIQPRTASVGREINALKAVGLDAEQSAPSWATAAQTVEEILAEYRKKQGSRNPLSRILCLIHGRGPANIRKLLEMLPPAWADHAVASIYALSMPGERRKQLGAYFTPPHLVDHLVSRLRKFGMDPVQDRLRDSAAGGAAFLVPLARIKAAAWKAKGASDAAIVSRLRSQLIGREIEKDLAAVANSLLRRMLVRELGMSAKLARRVKLVRTGDSLDQKSAARDRVDHEVGNPPFLRLRSDDWRLRREIFSEIASGRLNMYAIFVRRALDEVPARGLVGYVMPASFLGGPEFQSFRRRVLQIAEVLAIDLIEKRSGVFLGAIQDVCFVILRRRESAVIRPDKSRAASGLLRHDGGFSEKGVAEIHTDGAPWQLPGLQQHDPATLKDWGYRATVGYLVANRQPERLHKRAAKGRFPMIWAKAITSDGLLDFRRGAAFKGWGWADAPENAPYVVRDPCVAVQRTSARGQKRRLNAAAIPEAFIRKHGGVVGENHVILIVPITAQAVPPQTLADALNTPAVSAELDRVCGSASISVRLLESIRLGKPPRQAMKKAAHTTPLGLGVHLGSGCKPCR